MNKKIDGKSFSGNFEYTHVGGIKIKIKIRKRQI